MGKEKRDLSRREKKKQKWDVCRTNQHFLSQICSIDCGVCLHAVGEQYQLGMLTCQMEENRLDVADGINVGEKDDFSFCEETSCEETWQK